MSSLYECYIRSGNSGESSTTDSAAQSDRCKLARYVQQRLDIALSHVLQVIQKYPAVA